MGTGEARGEELGGDEPQLDSRIWGWGGQEMNPSFMQGDGVWGGRGRGESEGIRG